MRKHNGCDVRGAEVDCYSDTIGDRTGLMRRAALESMERAKGETMLARAFRSANDHDDGVKCVLPRCVFGHSGSYFQLDLRNLGILGHIFNLT